jgi:hypothetical protein
MKSHCVRKNSSQMIQWQFLGPLREPLTDDFVPKTNQICAFYYRYPYISYQTRSIQFQYARKRGRAAQKKHGGIAQSTQDRQSIALPRRSEKEKERKDPTIIRELCTPCASSPQIPHQPRPQPHTVSNLNLISSSQQPAPNSQTTPEPRVQKPPRRTQAQAAGLVLLHRNCPAICWRK